MHDRPPEPDPDGRPAPDITVPVSSIASPGRVFGPYTLRERIGSGGMGEVWKAEQQSPIRRTVALKLIKAGMDSQEVIARFEAERQALALMEHPSIAKVFDAATTPEGRPYFAMEYVPGIPITEYCDRHRLGTGDRLRLFQRVCEGVQHAHQKAVLHRDLKPSNVLVEDVDGRPRPKIIDFGVAKATTQKLTERTMYTALGQLIGTPEYMSPEQAELTGEGVDTRTDVYSLGVILYELLVGALPFAATELRKAGFEGILRMLREQDPPRPSTKLSSLGEHRTQIAQRRSTDTKRLSSQLRGGLDWIVMRALEKDRNRRYATPHQLAEDIQRYLDHVPVVAAPPSTAYRIRKFTRRNRLAVGIVTSATIVLLAFTSMTALQSRRVASERDRANQEAEAAEAVSAFLVDLFELSAPERSRGETITARELLATGTERIDRLADQPKTASRLLHTMGKVHSSLGLYDDSRSLLERAVAARRTSSDDPLGLAQSLDELGAVCIRLGDYESAESAIDEGLALRERLLPPGHEELSHSLNNRGLLLTRTGDLEGARSALEQALAIRERAFGPDDPAVATSSMNLATVMSKLGETAEARRLYERCLRIREQLWGEQHPALAEVLNNMGLLLMGIGDYEAARPLLERTRDLFEATMGPDHPYVAVALLNLAKVLTRTHHFSEAAPLYERALAIVEERFGADHPITAKALTHAGHLLRHTGDLRGARDHYDRALRIAEGTFGAVHPETADLLRSQASAALFDGEREEALQLLEEAVRRGYDPSALASDVEMASLRGDSRFEAIVASGQPD